jgi:hypothetical protein
MLYALRPPWSQMTVRGGSVLQVSTKNGGCRTGHGLGPGVGAVAVRRTYVDTPVSTLTQTPEGDLLSYPFAGIAFLLVRGRVSRVDVFRADQIAPAPPSTRAAIPPPGPAPSPSGPSPSPTTAPGAWAIDALAARMEESTLVVTGRVENRARAQLVYVEVQAFNPAGRPLGQSDAPVSPNPVPNGGSAAFEVRVPVTDVVRRYTAVVRRFGTITGSLAQRSGEITRDLQQFAAIVSRQIRAEVQTTVNPATPSSLYVVVTNGSPLPVAEVTVVADLTVTCSITTTVPREVRQIRETRVGSATVQQLRPGASGQAPLSVTNGICPGFVAWSATVRIGDVRIGSEN